MTILAFGCSIMHGAETVTGHQNIENTKYSYSQLIADHMGVDCINHAVCGMSNEGIFHNFFDTIEKHTDISMVLIGWTSHVREYWRCEGRDWFVIPSWCATTTDVNTPHEFFTDYIDDNIDQHPRICSDNLDYMPPLGQLYELLLRYKFDPIEYAKKTKTYTKAVKEYCKSKNIRLIETSAMMEPPADISMVNLNYVGNWRKTLGHPTREEHQEIAKQLIEIYKL